MRDRQSARITAGVWLLDQLEIADDVLVVQRAPLEVFQKVEGDLRFVLLPRFGNDFQIAAQSNGCDVVTHLLQCRDDVIFRPPGLLFFFDAFGNDVRRHQLLRQEDEDSESNLRLEAHNGIRW